MTRKRSRTTAAAVATLLIAGLLLSGLFLILPSQPEAETESPIIPLERIPRTVRPGNPAEVTLPTQIFQPSSSHDELWRIAGLVGNRQGQRFGFSLQILKSALNSATGQPAHPWGIRDIYAARVTLAVDSTDRLIEDFRFTRDSLGLAGFDHDTGCMHILDWRLCRASEETPENPITLDLPTAFGTLQFDMDPPAGPPLELETRVGMRFFLQDTLTVKGRLVLPETVENVRGVFFLEHLIGRIDDTGSPLVWNSFHLNLSNGMTLRLMQSRRKNGRGLPIASGILIPDNESPISLSPPATDLSASGLWKSPHSSAQYPLEWRIRIPEHRLDLKIRPLISDQETRLLRPVWDGAVLVRGIAGGQPVDGEGQIVLQGY